MKLGLKSGIPRQESPRTEIRSGSRFSELLKKVIRLGEAKFNSSEASDNISFSDNEPEILDTEFDVSVNNTMNEVFEEISGSGDEPLDMSTTPSTTPSTTLNTTQSTTSSTTRITSSRTAPRRKPWIKRRRITYRPAFKGLAMWNVDFR